jgi:putative transcription factor
MEDCELCGKKTDAANVIDVEGVEFRVCQKCTVGKKVVYKHQMHDNARKRNPIALSTEEPYIVVQNYGEVIRKGREKLDLPLKVVAEMISEKHSLLLRVEENKMKPTPALVIKLEKFLGISLMEKQDQGGAEGGYTPKAKPATMGEFINEN